MSDLGHWPVSDGVESFHTGSPVTAEEIQPSTANYAAITVSILLQEKLQHQIAYSLPSIHTLYLSRVKTCQGDHHLYHII